MSAVHILEVVSFGISDDDEGHHEADDSLDFIKTLVLLKKLRTENPDVVYAMYAEIDT